MALVAGAGLWLLVAAFPTGAVAGGSGNCCTPPPCCQPPSPPPSSPPCCTPGHNINIPAVNVFVAPTVVVNTDVRATAVAGAQAQGMVFVGGGGNGSVIVPPSGGAVGGLNVEGGKRRIAYEATRTLYRKVVIQAFCFDDREVPHPASQVFPERDVDEAYDGELYRCMAGTHMQWTVVEWKENVSFEGGKTQTCAKGEALYHVRGQGEGHGARLECRPQKPARDCNERSLLRRFGAGIKILTMMYSETYTAYREESVAATGMGMSLDGGVGGIAY
jgi:hypothetical protein